MLYLKKSYFFFSNRYIQINFLFWKNNENVSEENRVKNNNNNKKKYEKERNKSKKRAIKTNPIRVSFSFPTRDNRPSTHFSQKSVLHFRKVAPSGRLLPSRWRVGSGAAARRADAAAPSVWA